MYLFNLMQSDTDSWRGPSIASPISLPVSLIDLPVLNSMDIRKGMKSIWFLMS